MLHSLLGTGLSGGGTTKLQPLVVLEMCNSIQRLMKTCLHAGTLALIDRNFQGFGKELFTDAGAC